MSQEVEVKVCFLCEEEGKAGVNFSEQIEGDETFACLDCLAVAAVNEFQGKHKRSLLKPKMNWGFWVLIIGFILFLVTWFILKPRFGW